MLRGMCYLVDGLQLFDEEKLMVNPANQTSGRMAPNESDSFSMYNIDYDCRSTPSTANFEAYFNRPCVRDAIHVSSPQIFVACNNSILNSLTDEFVAPPAYSIMPAILDAGVSIHVYSGDRDFLFNHIGTELTIQNMTW